VACPRGSEEIDVGLHPGSDSHLAKFVEQRERWGHPANGPFLTPAKARDTVLTRRVPRGWTRAITDAPMYCARRTGNGGVVSRQARAATRSTNRSLSDRPCRAVPSPST
jgi:hypothetical protein